MTQEEDIERARKRFEDACDDAEGACDKAIADLTEKVLRPEFDRELKRWRRITLLSWVVTCFWCVLYFVRSCSS